MEANTTAFYEADYKEKENSYNEAKNNRTSAKKNYEDNKTKRKNVKNPLKIELDEANRVYMIRKERYKKAKKLYEDNLAGIVPPRITGIAFSDGIVLSMQSFECFNCN